MNQYTRPILAIVMTIALFLPMTAQDGVEKVKNVGQFTTLLVQDSVNVVYRNDPQLNGTVRWISGDHEVDDPLIINNNNGTLKIQVSTDDFDDSEASLYPDCPTLYVYSDFLNKILNYSDAQIIVESPAKCPKLEISLVGNGITNVSGIDATEVYAKITAGMGTVTLSGHCDKATFRMTGTGTIQADELKAESISCKIFGGGTIGCSPSDNLSVRGIGSTKIYYSGNPNISHKGGGKLIPMK